MAKKKEETITISKVAIWQGLTAVFAILFVVSLATGGFSGAETKNTDTKGTTGSGTADSGGMEISLEGAQILGAEDAPVTIFEWSDFQCPFCKRHFDQTQGLIEENYVDEGLVRIVYKHFPLDSIHPMARPAASASECAAEQGKFWDYHDLLFENQAQLSENNFKAWADTLGLDTAQFNNCYDSGKYADKVEADLQEGIDAGVRGTPGFIIDGKLVSGAQPYQVFQQAIDQALA